MAIKKSLKAQQKKKREEAIKEINAVIRNAVKNFDFLSTLLVEGDPEATYHNIMDFRESVEKMVEEINEEMKEYNSK
jgi:methionine synthase II (cobalamin-independent)